MTSILRCLIILKIYLFSRISQLSSLDHALYVLSIFKADFIPFLSSFIDVFLGFINHALTIQYLCLRLLLLALLYIILFAAGGLGKFSSPNQVSQHGNEGLGNNTESNVLEFKHPVFEIGLEILLETLYATIDSAFLPVNTFLNNIVINSLWKLFISFRQ